MGELFTPWQRYGYDRVYVADGPTKLGYLGACGPASDPTNTTDASGANSASVASRFRDPIASPRRRSNDSTSIT